jgi:hypothetical protein
VFFDSSLSPEENALLNLEVTPEIEQLLFDVAKQKGTLLEALVEEEMDDTYSVSTEEQIDHEKELGEAIPLFDEYFGLSERIDKLCIEYGWSELSAAKDFAWSLFKEEMDYNWLALDRFDAKADTRLAVLATKGQEPEESKWQAFLTMRAHLLKQVSSRESWRYNYTRSFYDKAIKLNAECREFWKTDNGQHLNSLIAERKSLFTTLVGADLWKYVAEYWKLRNSEISRTYLSENDNEGVDDPAALNQLRDSATALAETHLFEEEKEERGNIYWEKWYDSFLSYSLNLAKQGRSWMKFGGGQHLSQVKGDFRGGF